MSILRLRAAIEERITFQTLPRIVPADLGDTAGCLGAGLLAWDLVAAQSAARSAAPSTAPSPHPAPSPASPSPPSSPAQSAQSTEVSG
ncbi:putative sugar kinase [Streptomyces himastatinicus ATCC 53653]|uniref:Putative sugar kinase n=1 Tax=Streptomyces himastatinicus ATCC 53653 TaxID=457427 RepID=D9WDA7_9ACTN|nr:putative sugar kinase [Streptomyces himastatinicus ATCC 53653]